MNVPVVLLYLGIMAGDAPWAGNLHIKLAALLFDSGVMQQCLLTIQHAILWRTVPFEFLHPSSVDVFRAL